MDIELARTFLVVISGGSFVEAAKRLHVTQSTVSARIQRLEADLGAELFVRNKSGTTLTPAGRRFQQHASLLTRTVEQARQEIGVTGGFRASLTLGGRIGLWEGLLLRWLPTFAALAPDIVVRSLIGFEEDLMQALTEGRADIAVMYTPQARPGLTIESLLEERLVLVSTRSEPQARLDAQYVYVDWGPEFFAHHSLAFPDYPGAALTMNVGWLGLEHVLANGGSGYFPARLVRQHELAGRLHRVPEAPEFRLSAYLCFASAADSAPLALALDTIRKVAAEAG
ncbi:MAG: LysR family transcriptional regulator [Sinobacteraceae bacterium]|nr:LysR family transcriptional regulator [Nevskiaceae bacterium]MCP5340392.1 LysR family transcriptional regulator [Nevskiaceae bacterium]MCP5360232.1 LysR family transcriptional regulator [Nevskiaceae bacterium]MCP5466631.1 LysR family transcriptional regulator [Nevskiaceae bacterium]